MGEWTIVSGSADFDSTNDPNTQVSGLSIGENILEWSITGECGTSSDQIIITVIDAIPTISTMVKKIESTNIKIILYKNLLSFEKNFNLLIICFIF